MGWRKPTAARADKADEEAGVAKIAEMPRSDRAMAERRHAIIKAAAPALSPKTWYGMPAYAKDGKVVCFFTPAQKFNSRYGVSLTHPKERWLEVRSPNGLKLVLSTREEWC
jgi:hypothetical protein